MYSNFLQASKPLRMICLLSVVGFFILNTTICVCDAIVEDDVESEDEDMISPSVSINDCMSYFLRLFWMDSSHTPSVPSSSILNQRFSPQPLSFNSHHHESGSPSPYASPTQPEIGCFDSYDLSTVDIDLILNSTEEPTTTQNLTHPQIIQTLDCILI